ncbi:efflux RND transporter periplasmic adaptor subunit [Rhodobacteraceae bacterium KMM 6894]|nr:efflux RND transporter periplasmic adaptor subunit [Rhodobacteraceae bacterium KMM 6894]
MRVFPVLAAIAVSVLIYAFVFERDRLLAALSPAADANAVAQTETTEAASSTPDTADNAAKAASPVRVVAIHSQARTIDGAVVLRGQTEAMREVDVRAETSGRVISDPLRKGNFVEAGQLLCRLNPAAREATLAEARAERGEAMSRVPEAQARLAEAESRLIEAEINHNAATKLIEGGFASETRVASTRAAVSAAKAAVQAAKSGLEAAYSGIESAEATVAAATEEISRLEIKAPFAGLLESDTAELGSLLQPGALCANVIQLDPIKLVGFVPETEVAKVRVGAGARAQLVSGAQAEGLVTFLSRSSDPDTRTFRVEITVPNTDLALSDGQTAEILVASDGTLAHLLPQSALTLDNDGALGVRVIAAGGTADFIPVQLMRDTPTGVWVIGLPETADVIIIGQEYIISGVPVLPTFQDITQ